MAPDPEVVCQSDQEIGAEVCTDEMNTLMVPPDYSRWFDTATPMQPVRSNNSVTGLVDGDETFRSMVAAMLTARNDQHYIYLLNWWVDLDFQLPGSTSLYTQLRNAVVNRGVQVRAMFWDQLGTQNSPEVGRINAIPNATAPGGGTITGSAAAILDNNILNLGSHHQKILVIKGDQGLIAFCGGVDFNPDRITAVARQAGSPMHDVHCRISGPAAWDLHHIFVERWTDHPASAALDRAKGALRGVSEPLPSGTGGDHVQIGRTYGNGSRHGGITNAGGGRSYSFAPNGEQTAWRLTLHAIEQARQYIYMENQYLVSMAASNALRDRLANIQRLIILIPYSGISDLPQVWRRTRDFITNLHSTGHASKVSICYRFRAGQAFEANHNYIHAKIFIIDDEFSIIGSANCNRRGYTHDSEVVAGIHNFAFARDLRTRLWAEHLNMPASSLSDPIASAVHWFTPSAGTSIARYPDQAHDGTDTLRGRALNWNNQVDPDGA